MAQKKIRGKGEGALYQDARGLWTVTIELPPQDGERRRKVIRSKDKRIVVTKLAEMKEELRKRGDLPTASQTVAQWFTYWFENVVLKDVRPKTAAGYKSVLFGHIIPAIGSVKMDRVTSADIRRVHDRITVEKGLSSTYALNAHHVMSSSFEAAMKDGKIGRNPAKLVLSPRKNVLSLDVLTVPEAIHVLEHVSRDKVMGARWATALLTGARRGEVIGLERDRVTDVLDLSWQLQRLGTGSRGTRGAAGKPDVPADYEYRHLVGGLYFTRPKSKAGWRIVPLVEPLKSILERHIATTGPNPYGLVFLNESARPIDPDQDTRRWRKVLKETGIDKDVRLHDLRHTAVDVLYLAGVPEDLIIEIVGHSTRMQSRAYKSRSNRERLTQAMDQFSALFTPLDRERSETPALDA